MGQRTVLVYRSSLLPRSEIFIKKQVLSYSTWRGIVVGRRHLEELSLDGLDVRYLSGPHPSYIARLLMRMGSSFGVGLPWIVKKLKFENPSIFHVHFGLDAVDAWPLARSLNIPMIVTLHGFDVTVNPQYWQSGKAGFILRKYPKRLVELASRSSVTFIAVSEAIRARAVDYGIPIEKIMVRYIGIDVKAFEPGAVPIAERDLRILFVGRLVEKKGLYYLIQAMAEVQKSIPEAHLVVIGDGVLRAELEEYAVRVGVNVSFRGAQSNAEVMHELRLARVFCLPSVTARNGDAEGFGLVLLEAQASGVPVVTSANGGATEGILEGVTGFSFPERDVVKLTKILLEILKDNVRLTAMSSAARQFVLKKFDLDKCTQELEATYDEIAMGHYRA